MSNLIEFFVEGIAAPGGSKSAYVPRKRDGSFVFRAGSNSPVVNMTDAGGKKNKEWRKLVAIAGRKFMKGAPLILSPLKVEFIFFMPRPKSHYRTGRNAHLLHTEAPLWHVQKPDALKLARSTEDALTSIIWRDDCANVRICAEKRWCHSLDKPGCQVRIIAIEPVIYAP